jgi:glycosyltransferase involved in cell wall biosynthesis
VAAIELDLVQGDVGKRLDSFEARPLWAALIDDSPHKREPILSLTATIEDSDRSMTTPRRTRIVHVAGNLETGGMQNMMLQIVRNSDPSRYESVIVHFKGPNHFSKEIRANGWKRVKVPMSRKLSPGRVFGLARAVERPSPGHRAFALGFCQQRGARGMCGRRHFSRSRASAQYLRTPDERRLSPSRERADSHSDTIICCSKGVEEFYRANFNVEGARIRRIVNGIDITPFEKLRERRAELRAKFRLREDEFVVIYCARFEPHKQPGILVDALHHAAPRMHKWRAVFLGGGSIFDETRAKESSLFPGGELDFKGWTPNVGEHLVAADAYVLCSKNEGLALSIIEALASGLAVVASSVVGPREVITDGEDGLLVPVNSVEGARRWRSCASKMIAGSLARYRKVVRRRAQHFSLPRFMGEMEECYQDVLSRPAAEPKWSRALNALVLTRRVR